jgi:hypothetical protein
MNVMETSPSIEPSPPLIEREIPDGDPSRHGLRLAALRAFLASVLLLVPLCGGLGFVVLTASALAYARPTWSGNLWTTIGRSSFVAAYAGVGLAGGAAVGVTLALSRVLGVVESRLCRWLDRIPAALFERSVPAISVAALRGRYRLTVERLYGATVARLRLPAWIARRLHAAFRFRLADGLLPECERTGADVVGFAQVRDWLVRTGISLGFRPVRSQLRTARRLVLVLLVLLALFPFALLFMEGVDLLRAK